MSATTLQPSASHQKDTFKGKKVTDRGTSLQCIKGWYRVHTRTHNLTQVSKKTTD